jgi:hypothetical protein
LYKRLTLFLRAGERHPSGILNRKRHLSGRNPAIFVAFTPLYRGTNPHIKRRRKDLRDSALLHPDAVLLPFDRFDAAFKH